MWNTEMGGSPGWAAHLVINVIPNRVGHTYIPYRIALFKALISQPRPYML
jgi:hypothetical protein